MVKRQKKSKKTVVSDVNEKHSCQSNQQNGLKKIYSVASAYQIPYFSRNSNFVKIIRFIDAYNYNHKPSADLAGMGEIL